MLVLNVNPAGSAGDTEYFNGDDPPLAETVANPPIPTLTPCVSILLPLIDDETTNGSWLLLTVKLKVALAVDPLASVKDIV